ncbi:MAG TPA: 30S ribosomal protein S1 [Pyrinomonadaceae bacterium]|nr:30S ribosomal protein S1 [Pyrinomonadaceae bacterium]HMP65202.1 30S ribosomal protein S1 [Pyrinomonadaceae bacterium]
MTTEANNQPEEAVTGESPKGNEAESKEQTAAAPVRAASPAPEDVQTSGEIDFGAILEQFEQEQVVHHAGDLVEGSVVGVSDRGVLVDFGYKSEGVIPPEEFPGGVEGVVQVGDKIEAIIKTISSGDAPPMLSRSDALSRKVWSDIEEAFNNDVTVRAKVVDKTKGGLKVDLYGIEAFLPGSQIDSRPIRGLDTYIGEEVEAKIIKFSRRRNNIVLSRKVITDLEINEQKAETLGKIDVGYVVEGVVKNLTEYGAFVDVGGIDGLLHVTDMSWGRIQNPGELFKSGDHVQVKILKLDREKEKISLGYKQLQPDPWSTVVEVYEVNSRIKGKVSSVTDYGIFVELEPGVEGLVHVSEISWSKRSSNPKKLYHRGDEVEVQVLGVDTEEKRISLGMKQLQDNPWDTVAARFPVGSKIRGKVRNITDFGAFVEIEDGIDGLVHVSDITWAKKLKHPKELLKKDQEVEAIITHIDTSGQRLSLSMKDLTPSAWESFIATHKPGDTVRGKVSRFTSFGVFVELGEGLEGLCHISELAEERVEKPEDIVQLGQEMDFKILRIENEDQKIGLSYRAVGKDDEPIVDTRQYTGSAKSGMASLGELAKLKLGNTGAAETPEEEPAETSKKERRKAKKAESEAAASEEAPVEEVKAEEAPVEEAAAEEVPAEPAAESPAAEAAEESTEEAPAAEAPVEESTAVSDETTSEETSTETEEQPDAAESDAPAEESEEKTA